MKERNATYFIVCPQRRAYFTRLCYFQKQKSKKER
jgi:hypothetical protein